MAKQALDFAAYINILKSGYNPLICGDLDSFDSKYWKFVFAFAEENSHSQCSKRESQSWLMQTDPNIHGNIFVASCGLLVYFLDTFFFTRTGHNTASIREIFQV